MDGYVNQKKVVRPWKDPDSKKAIVVCYCDARIKLVGVHQYEWIGKKEKKINLVEKHLWTEGKDVHIWEEN